MASTGVPPTGRSRAFANRFSGFHRAKTFIGGSSLTGVSLATGVRRSRTRIDPCFRAARTHAPVRRCSSLIEISFMCHIVTHRWSHRQGMAHCSRSVLSHSSVVFTAMSSFPGPLLRGIARRRLRSIEAKFPRQLAASTLKLLGHRAPKRRILAGPRHELQAGRRPEARSFPLAIAAHFAAHQELLIAS
jgi:hypothetical protein